MTVTEPLLCAGPGRGLLSQLTQCSHHLARKDEHPRKKTKQQRHREVLNLPKVAKLEIVGARIQCHTT